MDVFGHLLVSLDTIAATLLSALFEPVPAIHSGINWTHANGRSPDYYLPETTGAGCARGLARGDFDNNGAVDVLITTNNGAPLLLRNQAASNN